MNILEKKYKEYKIFKKTILEGVSLEFKKLNKKEYQIQCSNIDLIVTDVGLERTRLEFINKLINYNYYNCNPLDEYKVLQIIEIASNLKYATKLGVINNIKVGR